jgi:GTP cyclohydrolase I
LTAGLREDPARHLERTFPVEHDDLVLVRDIPFYSMCEHHLIPFNGTAAVAYVPRGEVVGLSKVARCVRGYAAKPQMQERLTHEIAEAFVSKLAPWGVAVVIRAEHLCMGMRGVKADGTVTVTSAIRGNFAEEESARAEVMKLMEQ